MKASISVIVVVGGALLLYNVIPTEITVILSLILITALIINWDKLKTYFS